MWTPLLLSLAINNLSFSQDSATYLDYNVGARFSQLSPDLIETLHKAKHWDVDVSEYTSVRSAPNNDGCFNYTSDCQPDYIHHLYQLAIPEHPGYFYTITFSYNYYIISVKNGYLHQ